ncbi:RNase adapter RapZ [Solimonas sp. SE-A11]|uniref:RNase adapter RapZ n=1 Tax=Solimonas sp. SE-A11 TaxID=3054954 RepID=UPI00259CD835|nr:RNase adapter RapZ [Solimonas sp. SE-A11]MDM4770639.1 RNase adapter RapZ [Solimonas sp. SE-A11]
MKLVIVSGLSGAGKTVALKQYEDLGYYCIDNLPLALVGPMARRAIRQLDQRFDRLAIGIDARESPKEIEKFPRYLEYLREQGVETRVLFLRADDQTLLKRYSETRRRHPLASEQVSLPEAIALERRLLAPVANVADATIETTGKNLHELREEILAQVPGGGAGKLSLLVMSFGYKNGLPDAADYVFDVRCLPNPHWEPTLRKMTGRDAAVAAWLERFPQVNRMLGDIRQFLDHWLPEYKRQDRSYVTVAIGCTGGQHRSVYLVEKLGASLRERYDSVTVRHREAWEATERRSSKAAQ